PGDFGRNFVRTACGQRDLACWMHPANSRECNTAMMNIKQFLAMQHRSSTVVGMVGGYMFVVDNEDEVLRLYPRSPETACAAPIVSYDMRPQLNPTTSNQEADVEAAVKTTDANGTRIYWLGSHSNSKSGNARPNRNRLFATEV